MKDTTTKQAENLIYKINKYIDMWNEQGDQGGDLMVEVDFDKTMSGFENALYIEKVIRYYKAIREVDSHDRVYDIVLNHDARHYITYLRITWGKFKALAPSKE